MLHVDNWPHFGSLCAVINMTCLLYSCFRRVLPLPSDAWSEFTGDVFCHAHGSSLTSPTALLPKEGDCLVSESSVLIRRSAVDDHITVMDKRTIEVHVYVQCRVFIKVPQTWTILCNNIATGKKNRGVKVS